MRHIIIQSDCKMQRGCVRKERRRSHWKIRMDMGSLRKIEGIAWQRATRTLSSWLVRFRFGGGGTHLSCPAKSGSRKFWPSCRTGRAGPFNAPTALSRFSHPKNAGALVCGRKKVTVSRPPPVRSSGTPPSPSERVMVTL